MIPEYPISAFHPIIQEIICEYRDTLRFCPDYMSTTILYTFSIACGNRFKLKIKQGWIESPVLYAVIVGKAGVNKSAPLKTVLSPLKSLDVEAYSQYKAAMSEYLSSKNKQSPLNEEPPRRQQLIISDFTPEALSYAHEHNPMGLGVYSDELTTWLGNMGRYTKSGEEQFYLSLWSGIEININRRSSADIYIAQPFVSIIGGIQPALLPEVFGKTRSKNGFTHRMLFAFPDEVKREDLSDKEVSPTCIKAYNDIIKTLISIKDTHVMELTPEAYTAFREWRQINNDRINREENDSIAGIYSKIEIYLLRIALLLQLTDNICEDNQHNKVCINAILSAILLVNYYESTAIKVDRIIHRYEDPLVGYTDDKRALYISLPDEFSTEDAKRAALSTKVSERTLFEFLKDDYLFKKLRHGFYLKLK